jgi:hypothetical protein
VDPVTQVVAEIARSLGMAQIEVYCSQRMPGAIAVELTEPPAVILGARLCQSRSAPTIRFAAARALKLAQSWLSVPAQLSPSEFGNLLVGVLRLFRPDFQPAGLDPAAVAAEQQRLRKLVSGGMLQELAPYAIECASPMFDHMRIYGGIQHTGNRAGLVAAGSLVTAISALGHPDVRDLEQDPSLAELARFAVSDDHVLLRQILDGSR